MQHVLRPNLLPFLLRSLLLSLLLPVSLVAHGADRWSNQTVNGTLMAITPTYQLQIYQPARPSESVWGKINIPVKAEQLEELHKHRKSPNFPFIDVGVEVDKYYRTAQGHIHDDLKLITVEVDHRHWEGLKKGNRLIIRLPDGTELKESLKGSGAALRAMERR